MKLKFDDDAIRKLVQPKMDDIAKEYQKETDRIARTMKSAPIPEIVAELTRVVKKHGGTPDTKELTKWAEILAEGEHINFQS